MKNAYRQVTLKNKGFTLLEVLISVSIIAVVFVSIFRLQSGTMHLVSVDRFNCIAPMLAEHLICDIERNLDNWSDVQGDFGNDFPGIKWTCEISDVKTGDTGDFGSVFSSLKKIDVSIVSTGQSNRYRVLTWRITDE